MSIVRSLFLVVFFFADSSYAGLHWKDMVGSDGWCEHTCERHDLTAVGHGEKIKVCATFVGKSGQPGHYRGGYSMPGFRCSTEFDSKGTGGQSARCLCDDKGLGDWIWKAAKAGDNNCHQVCKDTTGKFQKAVETWSGQWNVCAGQEGAGYRPGYNGTTWSFQCTYEYASKGVKPANWKCLCRP